MKLLKQSAGVGQARPERGTDSYQRRNGNTQPGAGRSRDRIHAISLATTRQTYAGTPTLEIVPRASVCRQLCHRGRLNRVMTVMYTPRQWEALPRTRLGFTTCMETRGSGPKIASAMATIISERR